MKIDHHRTLMDTSTCQTFTEVIVADKANPYVLGTRLRVNHALIAEIEMLWTTTGYWLFNADNYLRYSSVDGRHDVANNFHCAFHASAEARRSLRCWNDFRDRFASFRNDDLLTFSLNLIQ